MKSVIYVFATIGSVVGGWLGSLLDHGSMFGLWGLLFGAIFGIVGIYIGYKISQNY